MWSEVSSWYWLAALLQHFAHVAVRTGLFGWGREKKSLAEVKVKKFDYGWVILDLSLMELIRLLLCSWGRSSLYIPCQISEFSQTMMARRLMQELDVIHHLIAVSQSWIVLILPLSNCLVEKYSCMTSDVTEQANQVVELLKTQGCQWQPKTSGWP